jgi:hypothetical protein
MHSPRSSASPLVDERTSQSWIDACPQRRNPTAPQNLRSPRNAVDRAARTQRGYERTLRPARDDDPVSMLTCPLCGHEMDARGPGVSSHRVDYHPKHGPSGDWVSSWVPFIEDLRGSPQRLVHPECFALESGVSALVGLVHERDKVHRLQEHERWKREQSIE